MDNISAKSDYDGVTIPAATNQVHSAAELNDRRVELQGAVTDSSQALSAADSGQLSKAMFANGVAAQSMIDSGGINTVVITPVSGASGLRVATPVAPDYSLLDGAIFSFKANNTNTGNMTVNVGQTVGTLIGAVKLFLEDGTTEIPVGIVVAGRYYDVRFDQSLDGGTGAFVLLGVITTSNSIQVVGTTNISGGSEQDMTDMSVSFTPRGTTALVMFFTTISNLDNGETAQVFINVGGSNVCSQRVAADQNYTQPISMQWLATGLTIGVSVTIKIRWTATSGSQQGASYERVLTVIEP